jgi:hypothetical protein
MSYEMVRTYVHEHGVYGIFFWRKGDPYTRFERFIVLVANFATSVFVTYLMQPLTSGCSGISLDRVTQSVVSFLFTQFAQRLCMVPCAKKCFQRQNNGKCGCIDCSSCMDKCATCMTVWYLLPFIITGVASFMITLDYKVYSCQVQNKLCSINEHTQVGSCGADMNCVAPGKHHVRGFRDGKVGLVCTVHKSGDNETYCNLYFEQDRCKVGLCIKKYAEETPLSTNKSMPTRSFADFALEIAVATKTNQEMEDEETKGRSSRLEPTDKTYAYDDMNILKGLASLDTQYSASDGTKRRSGTNTSHANVTTSSQHVQPRTTPRPAVHAKITAPAVQTTPFPTVKTVKYAETSVKVRFCAFLRSEQQQRHTYACMYT